LPAERPRLRKREIAFALAAGALGAGGAALVLDDDVGPERDRHEYAAEMRYDATGFDAVSVLGPQDVIIIAADEFKVTASGDPGALAQLEAVVEDGSLIIRPREGLTLEDLDDVTFTVGMPAITRVAVEGSGDVTVDRVAGSRFAGAVSGSGTLAIALLEADEVELAVTGSGDLDAAGTARAVAIQVTGSGEVHAAGLTGTSANVAIEGSGDVDLSVLEQAAVAITGSGEVNISGPAVCTVTGVGSGEVRCEGGGDAIVE
jgi:Putative auto-transporter adhesin, head GIN domain